MKRLLSLFVFFGFAVITIAAAAENDSSGFVGTWEGVYTSSAQPSVKNAVVMKIDSDSEGNIFLSSYMSGGSVVSPPPKVFAQGPGLLTLKIKSGWTIYLVLETKDLIKAKSEESGSPPYTATFTRK